jgi:hypothetical protein
MEFSYVWNDFVLISSINTIDYQREILTIPAVGYISPDNQIILQLKS